MESPHASGKLQPRNCAQLSAFCMTTKLTVLVLLCVLINKPGRVVGATFPDVATASARHRFWNASVVGQQLDRDYERGDQERQEFFEVSKPVDVPQGAREVCSQILLQHRFGNTINDPPTLRQYSPLPNCGAEWTLVLLRWTATCKGRQFDRIAAVWLSGVEIFRTCTAEPTPQGIVWTVEKDVTIFASLFTKPQLLALELANVVDDTYTGIYNVTLSAHFYLGGKSKSGYKESYGGVADVILPFAEKSPLNGGYWFQLQNESDVQTQEIKIPRNAYKAVLEICVSFHGPDEFWYTNPPNDFLVANNLTEQVAGNGTFREVLISIDGLLAGIVYPFPVFYTGGVDPYFWRPISAIASFILPSYDVEITPFLGKLVDGESHSFSVTVTNALPYWLLGANLHLWLDLGVESTTGALLEHSSPPLASHTTSRFKDLDGSFVTEGARVVTYKGYLHSSFGNLTTTAAYSCRFSNSLVYTNGCTSSEIHQESKTEGKVVVKSDAKDLVYHHVGWKFPLKIFYEERQHANKTVFVKADIEHGWQQDQQSQSSIGRGHSSFSSLRNKQRSKGELVIPPRGTISGVATTKQKYSSESTDGCYFRSVGASNYTFLYDHIDRRCSFSS